MTWSSRPYNNVPRSRSPQKSSHSQSKTGNKKHTGQTPEPDNLTVRSRGKCTSGRHLKQLFILRNRVCLQFQIKDENALDKIEDAIKKTAEDIAPNSGYCSKEELRKIIKKRLVRQGPGHTYETFYMRTTSSRAFAECRFH